jgi:hypothetical protein
MPNDQEGSSEVSFSMLENGLDFALSAVEHLGGTPSKRDLKYAVLHLYSGTVLVLKERLRRENWKLLFADPKKADEETFKEGNFHGPNLDQCLKSLEEIDVEISEDHERQLRLLANRRKHLEHFRFTDSAEAIMAVTADILGFLIDFIGSQFETEHLDNVHTDMLNRIRSKSVEFDGFVDSRWENIGLEIEAAGTVVSCPTCLEEACAIGDSVECKFCGYKNDDSFSAADEYITRVLGESRYALEKDGGIWPKHKCPSCDWYSLVDCESQHICFKCGATWEPNELSECSSCSEPVDIDMVICDDCFNEKVGKDDG